MTATNRRQDSTDRGVADQLLAAFLAERDVPCTSCGYNLRGVTGGACPECGKVISISLGKTDQATVAWFVSIVLYSIATGTCAFFAFIFAMIMLFEGGNAEERSMAPMLVCGFALSLSMLIFLIRARHRVWTWRPLRQWLMAASVLLVPVFVILGFAIALAIVG